MPYAVGILGATGAVGRRMAVELEKRDFPVSELRCFATGRSQGETLKFKDESIRVRAVTPSSAGKSFSGLDLLFASAGSGASLDLSPEAVRAGAVVVDNSSAFRMDDGVPLVVPEVNAGDLAGHKGIVANPNCSTIQMVVALKPIREAAGLKRVVASTYQSVSGIGHKGVEELRSAARARLGSEEFVPEVFPADIGFNLFPLIDRMEEGCHCKEEIKMVNETRKILGAPELPVSATTVRVPVFVGHAIALWVETREKLSRAGCIDALRGKLHIVVFDEMAGEATPTPADVADDDRVLIGRVREDSANKNCLMLWVVANNLRKGAATNAVQIAEELHARGLLAPR